MSEHAMSRRYAEPIAVEVVQGEPAAFRWRGRRFAVTVIGRWRLQTRWWQPEAATDRAYYRVQTRDWQVFELYHDAVPDAWILDVCQD